MGWSIRVDNTQHVLSISVNARRNVRPAHGTRIQADCRVGRIGKEKDRVKWWCAPIKGLFGTLPASSSTKHRDLTHIIVIALQRVHNHNAINQREKQWQIRVGKKGWNMVLFGFLFLFPFRCGCELRSIISWRARLINCSPNDDSNITTSGQQLWRRWTMIYWRFILHPDKMCYKQDRPFLYAYMAVWPYTVGITYDSISVMQLCNRSSLYTEWEKHIEK